VEDIHGKHFDIPNYTARSFRNAFYILVQMLILDTASSILGPFIEMCDIQTTHLKCKSPFEAETENK
jgi:hypothetical protein